MQAQKKYSAKKYVFCIKKEGIYPSSLFASFACRTISCSRCRASRTVFCSSCWASWTIFCRWASAIIYIACICLFSAEHNNTSHFFKVFPRNSMVGKSICFYTTNSSPTKLFIAVGFFLLWIFLCFFFNKIVILIEHRNSDFLSSFNFKDCFSVFILVN